MIYLLVASLFLLTVIVITILIYRRTHWAMLLVLMPFLIFNIGFSWHTVNELWGQAREGFPDYEVEILRSVVKKPSIYLLLTDSKDPNAEPTLHKIPYSKESEKKLKEAQQKRSQGIRMLARPKEKQKNDSIETFEIYQWDYQKTMPK